MKKEPRLASLSDLWRLPAWAIMRTLTPEVQAAIEIVKACPGISADEVQGLLETTKWN